MTQETTLTKAALAQFIGTERWYRHPLAREVLYTDGARFVAEAGGAYWLLDEIAFAQRGIPAVAAEEFQSWTLTVRADRSALLACGDGNGGTVFRKEIAFTDFPLPEITLFYSNNVILLPSEW
jgi:hypothetical protein